jgi:multiple sugar transport system ATP-binding protein
MASAVVLNDIVKNYGKAKVIHGVSLTIDSGEFVVFVGPSGCGKSTLLRMIAGLEDISGGELRIDGRVMNDVDASRRGIAMVFQSYALYPHMSVYQNMAFGLESARMPKEEVRLRVKRAADVLQIGQLLERKPKQLSGGQRQRVAIGRAIVREPQLFLFDEPLSNLDAELRVEMRVEIKNLHQRLSSTMIYVTHDQVEAMTMADKIIVLRNGLIEQVGAPLDLYNNPRNLFVAGFLGSPKMNFLQASVVASDEDGTELAFADGARLRVKRAMNTLAIGDRVTVGARPEHLQVQHDGSQSLTGTIELVEQLGGETYLYARLASGERVTVEIAGQHKARTGDAVGLRLDDSLVHVFGPGGEAA